MKPEDVAGIAEARGLIAEKVARGRKAVGNDVDTAATSVLVALTNLGRLRLGVSFTTPDDGSENLVNMRVGRTIVATVHYENREPAFFINPAREVGGDLIRLEFSCDPDSKQLVSTTEEDVYRHPTPGEPRRKLRPILAVLVERMLELIPPKLLEQG